jgi:myo-inositol catabolism protein IolC
LHHRWYCEASYTGQEPEESVMLVCRACHQLIHGLLMEVVVNHGSLANQGDRGTGNTARWKRYLGTKPDPWDLED